jgi:hypothetical protein
MQLADDPAALGRRRRLRELGARAPNLVEQRIDYLRKTFPEREASYFVAFGASGLQRAQIWC